MVNNCSSISLQQNIMEWLKEKDAGFTQLLIDGIDDCTC